MHVIVAINAIDCDKFVIIIENIAKYLDTFGIHIPNYCNVYRLKRFIWDTKYPKI